MAEFGVHEAKTHFSKLLQRAVAGEEIIITRSGEPLVKLVSDDTELTLSAVVPWEIAVKWCSGNLHRDPFDRLLVAQARIEGIAVVTADEVFADYGVEVVAAR